MHWEPHFPAGPDSVRSSTANGTRATYSLTAIPDSDTTQQAVTPAVQFPSCYAQPPHGGGTTYPPRESTEHPTNEHPTNTPRRGRSPSCSLVVALSSVLQTNSAGLNKLGGLQTNSVVSSGRGVPGTSTRTSGRITSAATVFPLPSTSTVGVAEARTEFAAETNSDKKDVDDTASPSEDGGRILHGEVPRELVRELDRELDRGC